MPHPSSTQPTLLLFGAGGHGRVVADAAQRQSGWPQLLATDRDPARCQGELVPGVPLVTLEAANALPAPVRMVHIAIGDNAARAQEAAQWAPTSLATVMHPMASVSPWSAIASGCFIAAGAVVAPQARLGQGCIVNHGAVVDHDVQVGDFCHIAPRATLGGGVQVGAQVLVGAGAVVLPGLRIAAGVTIGAGAVVCTPLDEPGTYVGVPARKVT